MSTVVLRYQSDTVVSLDSHAGHAPGRMGRRALAAVLIGLVVIGPGIALGFSLPAAAGPDGAARPWEAGQPVGPYGQADLRTGHVLTTIPSKSRPTTRIGRTPNRGTWRGRAVVEPDGAGGPESCGVQPEHGLMRVSSKRYNTERGGTPCTV